MRKTLYHRGVVLRSHVCLVEMQRNKQKCFVWGKPNTWSPLSFLGSSYRLTLLLAPPATPVSPATLSRMNAAVLESLCCGITGTQNLRTPECEMPDGVETACTSESGRTKVQTPVCCSLAMRLQVT